MGKVTWVRLTGTSAGSRQSLVLPRNFIDTVSGSSEDAEMFPRLRVVTASAWQNASHAARRRRPRAEANTPRRRSLALREGRGGAAVTLQASALLQRLQSLGQLDGGARGRARRLGRPPAAGRRSPPDGQDRRQNTAPSRTSAASEDDSL